MALSLLAGCADYVRDQASTEFKAGHYEAAIAQLEVGLEKYPDSTILRAGLLGSREEATGKLLDEARRFRSRGDFDGAQVVLDRALAIDPSNKRVMEVQANMIAERRAAKGVQEARDLMAKGNKVQALKVVESGLRDVPSQPELLALQRRLGSELRYDDEATGRGARTLAETRPISLDFRAAPIGPVLEAITRGSGINFILDRDVRQDTRVTIVLKSAKFDEALDLVLAAGQLSRRIVDPQTVLIFPNTPEKQREHQDQVVRVFQLANANGRDVAAMLKSALRVREAYVDERANLVVLRESPEIIRLAERLVALQDASDPEVMLEVEILEVKRTRLTALGVDFPDSFTLTPLSASGAAGLLVNDLRNLNGSRIGVSIPSLIVNLRREVGDVNILANPRIRAKNKEKARIMIGDKVPVVTATTSSTGFVSESVSYLDVGLKLEAEPTITPDDDVSIKLALEVSSIANTLKTAGGSTVYQIGTRNANTVLRLHDNETQLLAGLISSDDRTSSSRVPGLGDLPIAGRLFSSQTDDNQRTELVLAITPRIVRPAVRADISDAELWVGSENYPRLQLPRGRSSTNGPVASIPPLVTAGVANEYPNGNAPAAPGPVNLSWTGPKQVPAGQTFTLTLYLSAGVPLRNIPLEISYPSDKLEVVGVSEGEFFRKANVSANFAHAVFPEKNLISAGFLSSDSRGASGRNSILQIQFKAIQPGAAGLSVLNFKPVGIGQPAPVGENPGYQITVK